MFNKPNLFPKATEPQSARPGQRPVGVAATVGESASTRDTVTVVSSASQNPATAGKTAVARDETGAGGSRLIVGPEVKLKGAEILDCDTLVVEGHVSATMDSRVLRIAESGAFEGTVGVDVAEIFGRFDGELTARGQLFIHASGRVSGKIRYGKIFIEEGGQISGDIKANVPDDGRDSRVERVSGLKSEDQVVSA